MSPLVPLLAQDAGDLIWIAIMVVFCIIFFLSAVGRWLIARVGQQQRPGGQRPARQPPGGKLEDQLEDEIGDFLRRAARRRQGRPAPPARRPARPPAMAEPIREQAVEVEVVREGPVGGRMKEHVKEYLNSGKFERRADELGEEVAQADEQIEQRLHAKFDHEVSRLAGTPGESAEAPGVEEAEEPEDRVAELPPTAAAGLAAMLSNSVGIRQAIVINEILRRPEDRWT